MGLLEGRNAQPISSYGLEELLVSCCELIMALYFAVMEPAAVVSLGLLGNLVVL